MFMGGLYLAIDATAGERERGSLEPLFTTPAPRAHLIYGKLLAVCVYMFFSLTLTLVACALVLPLIRIEDFGMTADLGAWTVVRLILVTLPLIPLGAALMALVASFTRSYREAQSYLGFVIVVPTLPLAFVGALSLQPSPALMAIPSLSQHFLMTSLLRGDALVPAQVLISAGTSLTLGIALAWFAGRLYMREAILG
jgi:sodium transport system permease protein